VVHFKLRVLCGCCVGAVCVVRCYWLHVHYSAVVVVWGGVGCVVELCWWRGGCIFVVVLLEFFLGVLGECLLCGSEILGYTLWFSCLF